ncbi:MAG: hypothetical protein J5523_05415 [Muribaculaceae bacterium]|nr:hypothetical protein [Muribaculaceae bacterium]
MKEIEDILEGVAKTVRQKLETTATLNYSLLGGNFGEILFLYYYSRVNHDYLAIAEQQTDRMFADMSRIMSIASYCNGLAGLAIGLNELQRDGFMQGIDDAIEVFDDAIETQQQEDFRSNRHDFLHGFIGLGFYWLMRYRNSGVGIKPLMEIVEYLSTTCNEVDEMLRWLLPEGKRDSRYNISLSHGLSSTIILLTRIDLLSTLTKHEHAEIERLVSGAVSYLNYNRLDLNRFGSWFPMSSIDTANPAKSRLAWCYGDLGVAQALLSANRIGLALDVFQHSALRRDLIENRVYDATICHGTAGLGTFFDYLAHCHPSKLFLDAADYWRNQTLRKVEYVNGNAQFRHMSGLNGKFEEGHGILVGTAGVGLYLLDCIGIKTPLNRFLLLEPYE